MFELGGVAGLWHGFTDEERLQLRNVRLKSNDRDRRSCLRPTVSDNG